MARLLSLNYGPDALLPAEVAEWTDKRDVTALVVLKDGEIVHESYYKGTASEDLRISWSVAKSYLSALFGVLLDEGQSPLWMILSRNMRLPSRAVPMTGQAFEMC